MGSMTGVMKQAAARIGCSPEEWQRRREAGERWCFRCRHWKAAALFSLDASRPSGKSSSCKECTSDASTASRYGLSVPELLAFRVRHQHRCGICCRADGALYIDHDHDTGKLRGLLCPGCNTAIGQFREDPVLFAAALTYLEKHSG